jgi:hypothetical protein
VVGGDQQDRARDRAQASLERIQRLECGGVELARGGPVVVTLRVDAIPVEVDVSRLGERGDERRDALAEARERREARAGGRHAVEGGWGERARVHDDRAHAGLRQPLVQRGAVDEHLRVEARGAERVGPVVARALEAQRRDDVVDRGLVDVPLVQAVLADRPARVHRGHVRGRRGGELRLQVGDLEPAQEGMARMALEEPAPEAVEQHDADPLALAADQQPLHVRRDVGEGAHARAEGSV